MNLHAVLVVGDTQLLFHILTVNLFAHDELDGGKALKFGNALIKAYTVDTVPTPEAQPISISGASISAPSFTYTGEAQGPSASQLTVTLGGRHLTAGTDYEVVSYANNVNAGTATVTIQGRGNYSGAASGSFSISPASLAYAAASAPAQSYTGSSLTPSVTVKLGSKTLAQGTDYTVTYANNVKVGTASFTVHARGNYSGSVRGTFRITENQSPISLATGIYTLWVGTGNSQVLDVSGGSSQPGANVQTYASNGTGAQRWYLQKSGNAYIIRCAGSNLYLTASGSNVVQSANRGSASLWKILGASAGRAILKNVATGKALDVSGAARKSGTNVQVYQPNFTPAQFWSIRRVDVANMASMANGSYTLWAKTGNRQVLDVSGGASWAGANVQTYASNGTNAQRWYLSRSGIGYTLRSTGSGLYLTQRNGNVGQYGNSGFNSLWQLRHDGSGYTLVNAATGKVLDVSGADTRSGANVQVYSSNNTKAQRWTFASVGMVRDGNYAIQSSINRNLQLDISGGSRNRGANVQVWRANGTQAQCFSIRSVGAGWYTIVSTQSGKALDISGGSSKNGANVQQWDLNGTAAQLWKFEMGAAGLVLRSKLGTVLDLAGSANRSGTNVWSYAHNGTKAQQWFLRSW